MGQDNSELSPEKQLLKLIEESNKGAAPPPAAPAKPVAPPPLQAAPPQASPPTPTGIPKTAPAAADIRRPGPGATPAFSMDALHSRILFAKEKNLAAFLKSFSGPLDIKKINLALSVLALAAGVYFVTSSAMLATRASSLPAFSFKSDASLKSLDLKQETNLRAFAYYMEKVHSRDIFKIGRMQAQATTVIDEAARRAAQEAIMGKFRLVGISWSDDPDAMVEETTSGSTHFMKRGQVMDGVKVQAIFKDKVVLNYQGVDVELR